MKKTLSVLLIACLMTGVCCLTSAETAAPEQLFDTGRITVPVPEGWGVFQTDPSDETTLSAVRGGQDVAALFLNPSISIMYAPLGTLVMDTRELTDSSEDIEPFSLGGYDWAGYRYISFGMEGINLTAKGDFGTLTVILSVRGMMGGDTIGLDDPGVQTILSGIRVKATIEADWVTINEDGSVTVRLPLREGCEWTTSYSMSDDLAGGENGPEGEIEETVLDGVYTATVRLMGSGAYGQGFSLSDEEQQTAEAFVVVLCEEGRATALTNAYIRETQ